MIAAAVAASQAAIDHPSWLLSGRGAFQQLLLLSASLYCRRNNNNNSLAAPNASSTHNNQQVVSPTIRANCPFPDHGDAVSRQALPLSDRLSSGCRLFNSDDELLRPQSKQIIIIIIIVQKVQLRRRRQRRFLAMRKPKNQFKSTPNGCGRTGKPSTCLSAQRVRTPNFELRCLSLWQQHNRNLFSPQYKHNLDCLPE